MNFQSNKLRDAVLVALVAGVASTATAQAQEATNLDRISVTGSRIKSTDIETSQPVLSLTRADIDKQGVTSVADILQRVAANGAALNRTYNNGGDGSAGVSLRNLGSERTLVLVNGRRWTTGLDGSVDLNTIPTAMIERIDVLKDGASTIYGSDAIAGVVNIITKQNFDGAEANFYKGQYSAGDGDREAADFTLGTTTDRASLVLGVSYVNEKAVMAGDRKISAGGPPFFSGQSSTGIPGSYLRNDERYIILNGVETPFDPNVHGYNTAPDNYLLTPNERTSLFAVGSYNVTDNITFRTEAMYNERKSEQLLAAMPVTGMDLSAGSMYNPYGVELEGVARRFNETGGRSFNQNVKNWHFYGGFEGFFEFADRNFDWDVGYRYDKTDQNDLTYGLFNKQRLAEAYGPSAIRDGKAVCLDSTGAIIAGCAPINPLGGMGSISQEALDYTSFTAHDSASLVSKGYYANISGEIVQLPAGALGFAAGYEYRKETGQFDPDAFIASGLSTGNGASPTKGSYDLDEFFLELSIPVLADLPGAKLLDFSAATRYSKYSNFGNTTNNKFGFRWKPIDDLMVRGNYSEGFRAPSINNLYRGDADSFESYIDPCSSTSGRRTGAIAAQCAAEGVPIGFVQPGAGSGAKQTPEPFTWQANPNLKPETSKSTTFGLVWSPQFVQGLDLSLDWYKYEISDMIIADSVDRILRDCYVLGNSARCADVVRGNDGHVSAITYGTANLGKMETEGYDLGVKYRLPELAIGQFNIDWTTSYMSKYDEQGQNAAGNNIMIGRVGEAGLFRVRSNLGVNWQYGDFGVNYTARYYSGMKEGCIDTGEFWCNAPNHYANGEADPLRKTGSNTFHDLQVSWKAPWDATIALGANNVFDHKGPLMYSAPNSAFAYYGGFDVGRFLYMKYTQRF